MSDVRVYARESVTETGPGSPCPFTGTTCQDGGWLWDMEDAPGICSAPTIFADDMGGTSPRDYYDKCVMETLEG